MPLVPYLDPDDAEGSARELLEADAGYYDRPSLFARAMATNPRVFAARNDYHRRIVREGDVDTGLKELAYLAVSVANDCAYCTASHGERLVEDVGLSAVDIEAVGRGDFDGFGPAERAVLAFADAVAREPAAVTETDVTPLREAGFSDADLIELLAACAAAVAANTIADALGIDPADRAIPFAGTRAAED